MDRILTYRFKDGRLSPGTPAFVAARETSGPRHIAFHPDSSFAYCVNELDSTVTTYRYSSGNGSLQPLQIVSTLPETFAGNSRASEIEVDKTGRYVYASNRGYDSIAVFKIDQETGFLSLVEAEQSHGRTPRFMTFTPNGRFMFVLNEESDDSRIVHCEWKECLNAQTTGRPNDPSWPILFARTSPESHVRGSVFCGR